MRIDDAPPQATPYEMIGGEETVAKLVNAFYDRVAKHPKLAPIFPDDFSEVRKKQFAFLTQFFGGPPLFAEQYGSPMLRRRHLPHPVTPSRAKAWLDCMEEALDEAGIQGDVRAFLWERLSITAHHMVNTHEGEEPY